MHGPGIVGNLTFGRGGYSVRLMKQMSTGIQVLMLITVLVMQAVGPWCCFAADAACCSLAVEANDASLHGCCSSDSEREETPACCIELAPEPQLISLAAKFQQPEPSEVDLPNWELPSSEIRLSAKDSSLRFIEGIELPPDPSELTARFCVRQI